MNSLKSTLLTVIVLSIASNGLKAQQTKKLQGDKKVQNKKATVVQAPVMTSLVDSFSYAAGMNIAQNMKSQGVDAFNGELMVKAIQDVFSGKETLLTEEMANNKLQDAIQTFMAKKAKVAKEKESGFFKECAAKPGMNALPNGLHYEVLKASAAGGIKPTAADTVVVHYKGTLTDGTEFDNSYKRGEPARFPLGGVIRGWTEILQLMSVGSQWRVYIPSELGYGERGAGGAIPPNATLIFEIDLLEVIPATAGK